MHTPEIFTELLLILLVSVPVALLCLRLKTPMIVGLMLTGMVVGPYGLGLITDIQGIEILAELGVTLLLLSIGLEFSIARLSEIKRMVLVGGGLQVGLTVAATAGISLMTGRSLSQSVFFGFLIALSSTAIVLKTYVERREVDSPHGKASVGILIFQDLSIVLMLLLVPILGGTEGVSTTSVLISLGTSLGAVILAVAVSWLILPRLFRYIGKIKSPEVFLLTVVLFALGMAWVTSHFGLSLALGGFLAGVVIAGTDYDHRAASEILPFRDVFNSIFFVSIGLLLSLTALFSNILIVLLLIVGLIAGKLLIIWLVIRLLGYPQRVAIVTGLGLAQIGEFSFVLAKMGQSSHLLGESEYQIFLAAAVISMIVTPFLIEAAPRFGYFLQSFLADRILRSDKPETDEADIHLTCSGGLQQHVIIVGYGLNGRNLARVLRSVGIPYTVLDLDPETVRAAKANGEKINLADATRREVLQHAGIEDAWAVVLAMSDPQAARRTVDQATQSNPDVHVIVRTRYVSEIVELLKLGADEVIPEEFETSIEIFARVLSRYGIAREVIEGQIDRIRQQGYEMLRTTAWPPTEPLDKLSSAFRDASTRNVTLSEGSSAIGKGLGDLDIRNQTGATVIAVLRGEDANLAPGSHFELEEGDVLVLLGSAAKIEQAVRLLDPPPVGKDRSTQ